MDTETLANLAVVVRIVLAGGIELELPVATAQLVRTMPNRTYVSNIVL